MLNVLKKQYSKEAVAIIADEIRLKYSSAFPVNVMEIANKLGLKVYTYDEINPNVSGMFDPKNKRIYINQNDLYLRQKFSIAREIGRWILDYKGVSPKSDEVDISYRNVITTQYIRDVRANYFAACLIMPEKETREAWEMNDYNLDKTAKYLIVGRLALSIRLDSLGLLNE